MLTSHFCQPTLDDLLRDVFEAIRAHGRRVHATRGWCTEVTGIMLELSDVRARLSRSETRGRPFSALGEFCWYMSGRSDFSSIDYYVRNAYDLNKDVEPDGVTISGAYGPRLIGSQGNYQLERVIERLSSKASTRQAVLQLFDADDLSSGQRDVPCTCTLQLLQRDDKLEMVTYMRSNDAFLGLPHDVFCFTMLQEWIACRLGVEVGTYKHAVGSLHIYDDHTERVQRFLDEGFQSTLSPMPPMPADDPVSSLAAMLDAEAALRSDPPDWTRAAAHEDALDPYWADLVRLLHAYRHAKDQDANAVRAVQTRMASEVYFPFLLRRAQDVANRLTR